MPISDQIGTMKLDQIKREVIPDEHYYVRPCWEVIKTMSDLKKLKLKGFVWEVNTENHPRRYFYFLIIASSERKSQIFVLNHSQYQFMERLKKQDGMLNARYFDNGRTDEKGHSDFMMWLIKMGVISIEIFNA